MSTKIINGVKFTPTTIERVTESAAKIPKQRLWINPDCGLKTRRWPEIEAALKNMVSAAARLREMEIA